MYKIDYFFLKKKVIAIMIFKHQCTCSLYKSPWLSLKVLISSNPKISSSSSCIILLSTAVLKCLIHTHMKQTDNCLYMLTVRLALINLVEYLRTDKRWHIFFKAACLSKQFTLISYLSFEQ